MAWLAFDSWTSLFLAVLIAELWRATSLVLVIVVAGLQGIPRDYEEAAAVFGASPWRRLWTVILPLLRPSLQVALILRTILAFQTFAVARALTGENFPVLVGETYRWYVTLQDPGVAAALALVVLVLSMVTSVIYLRTAAERGRPMTAPDRAPLRRHRRNRVWLQVACIAVTAFMAVPLYLITLAAVSSRASLNAFPLSFLPTDLSLETLGAFLSSTGVVPSFGNSLIVGLWTLVLSLLIGVPAAYGLARTPFAGKEPYQLFLLFTRALPIVVLSVPLAQLFLTTGLYDTTYAVILLHTALSLPTTILICASVFLAVPVDVEEAARVFGCTPAQAFRQVVAPMALPGIAAAAIFTFVQSWNEVLAASILTLNRRTLPAQVLSSLGDSPLAYRFAGGFALVLPALLFIALMRRYLTNMWGSTIR